MLVLFVVAQTSAVVSNDGDRVVIDLTVSAPCADEEVQRLQGEIVVCAKADGGEGDRPAVSTAASPQAVPRAELQLADGAVLSAEVDSADLGMVRSQRLMVRLKYRF